MGQVRCGPILNTEADSKSVMDRYDANPLIEFSDTFDILNWWSLNEKKYPILSLMARDILSIPITSVASESAFSTSGRVIDNYRTRLAPSTAEALICTQNWLNSEPVALEDEDDHEINFSHDLASELSDMMKNLKITNKNGESTSILGAADKSFLASF